MIYLKKPENFEKQIEVSGRFIEYQGKFLLLLRPKHKSHGGTWQLPGGKHEKGGDSFEAVKREIYEELKISLDKEPSFIRKFYVRHFDINMEYNVFRCQVNSLPQILICDEHEDYKWVTPEEALSMQLILDGDVVLKHTYKI